MPGRSGSELDDQEDPRLTWDQGEWYEETQRLEAALETTQAKLQGAEGELERWKNGVERMLGGLNVCSRLAGHHGFGRDPDCPVCCPNFSELVAEHRKVAAEAAEARARSAEERGRGLREAMERIKRLQKKWDAPYSRIPPAESNAAWAAVGSEAHRIAVDALARSGSLPDEADAD
jgi:hypothetical protein